MSKICLILLIFSISPFGCWAALQLYPIFWKSWHGPSLLLCIAISAAPLQLCDLQCSSEGNISPPAFHFKIVTPCIDSLFRCVRSCLKNWKKQGLTRRVSAARRAAEPWALLNAVCRSLDPFCTISLYTCRVSDALQPYVCLSFVFYPAQMRWRVSFCRQVLLWWLLTVGIGKYVLFPFQMFSATK